MISIEFERVWLSSSGFDKVGNRTQLNSHTNSSVWLCSIPNQSNLQSFDLLRLGLIKQGLNNQWNRRSENQSINRWQSMPINRLISIIDEQSMLRFFVIINFIDYQFLSIINTNRSVNWHRLSSIGFHFWCLTYIHQDNLACSNASVNSSCAHPPPRATAGHLHTLSVLGVGH